MNKSKNYNVNLCVCCGCVIPEGVMVCYECEKENIQAAVNKKKSRLIPRLHKNALVFK